MKKPNFTSKRYLILALAIMLLLPIGQALAADITVDADCSLPNAVRSANGEELLEPLIDCEVGDSADGAQDDDEMIPGLDTITIDISGTDEGAIALDATLAVNSHIVVDGAGYSVNGGGNQIFSITLGFAFDQRPDYEQRLQRGKRRRHLCDRRHSVTKQ